MRIVVNHTRYEHVRTVLNKPSDLEVKIFGPLGGLRNATHYKTDYIRYVALKCDSCPEGKALYEEIKDNESRGSLAVGLWDEDHIGSALITAALKGDESTMLKILKNIIFFQPIQAAMRAIVSLNVMGTICEFIGYLSSHECDMWARLKFYEIISKKCVINPVFSNFIDGHTLEWILATVPIEGDDSIDRLIYAKEFMDNVRKYNHAPMIVLRKINHVSREDMSKLKNHIRWLAQYEFTCSDDPNTLIATKRNRLSLNELDGEEIQTLYDRLKEFMKDDAEFMKQLDKQYKLYTGRDNNKYGHICYDSIKDKDKKDNEDKRY